MHLPEIDVNRRKETASSLVPVSVYLRSLECYEDSTRMNILHVGLSIISCYPTQICNILNEKEQKHCTIYTEKCS